MFTQITRGIVSAILIALVSFAPVWAQSGKIAGTVTDQETGEPLPGVNIVLEGTTQGATTDAEGYYVILNVTPATYIVRASFVGYATQVVENVEVNVDLTTTLNIEMQEEAVGLDEVTVQAQEPVVKPDISASVSNLSNEQMQNIPVMSVDEVIGLQAGVQGLSVRGGDVSSMSFQVDGSKMFDDRSQTPFTGVSFTAISQVQVQTGGFNAEHGNLRSGLVNVVTKDAPRNRYTADVMARYAPPQKKYFGDVTPGDRDFYYMRPFLDPEVAMDGTHNWDRYTALQYPSWDGWNAYAENNPELSAEEWQQVFEWYHRKDFSIQQPDYVVDGSFGGPVPGISNHLGNLRFFASYRQTQNAYMIPQRREAHKDRLGRLKLTSDIASGLKLEVYGLLNDETGHTSSRNGYPNMYTGQRGTSRNMVNSWTWRPGGDWSFFMYGTDGWSLMDIQRQQVGTELTHTLGSNTFYEIELNRMHTEYTQGPGPARDLETVQKTVGGLGLDEAPYGWGAPGYTPTTPTGMKLGGYYGESMDTSWTNRWTGRFDLTSQLNRYSQLKTGVDVIHVDQLRKQRSHTLQVRNVVQDWHRSTFMGAVYAQNKLEFEGLIANVGLRLDNFRAVGEWFQFSRFDTTLAVAKGREDLENMLPSETAANQLALSPRLGISFPITTDSKLFLNYGHFREMLNPADIYRVGVSGQGAIRNIRFIGNPSHPMPRSISYEVGYEHNLFNQFLIRLTGYYKDLSLQSRSVSFSGSTGEVNYTMPLPYNYEDIRGFEATLERTTGSVRGFLNYTFMASERGEFGYSSYFENPVEAVEYAREYRNIVRESVPRPYARANVSYIVSREFGPELAGGIRPLADWRLNLLANWQAGSVTTYCGGGGGCPVELENNVRWKDDWQLDLRLTKNFNTQMGQLQFFMDVNNALNIRELNTGAFTVGDDDQQRYMRSLHLSLDAFEDIDVPPYRFVPGDDRPGDFRKEDVEFVPIEVVENRNDLSNPSDRALYYEADIGQLDNGTYYEWNGSSWEEADDSLVDQVLEDKAYIDMPNLRSFWFLYPRQWTFGIRMTF
jgi:hypothetical protein